MITTFEHITEDLNKDELNLVTPLIAGFKNRTKQNPIKAPEIISRMKQAGYKISEPRLRKLCNYIRSNSLLPLIATSAGYFTSYELTDVQKQVRSLQERSDAILASAEGLKKFLT